MQHSRKNHEAQTSPARAVLGSGYVCLSTVTLFAETGFKVVAIDLKREPVKAINSGLSPVNELVSAN